MSNTAFKLIVVFCIIVAACCIPIVIGIVVKRVLKRRHPDSVYLKSTSAKVLPDIAYVVIVGIGTMYILEAKPPEVLRPALDSHYGFLVKMAVLLAVLYLASAFLGVLRLLIFRNSKEKDA